MNNCMKVVGLRVLTQAMIGLVLVCPGSAQGPKPFVPPKLKGDVIVAGPDANAPWKSLYTDPRQAAVGAMKVGQKEVRPNSSNERAFNLFLMSTRRDPTFVKPVFNLGVLCEMGERWEDALNFFQVVPIMEQDARIVEAANSEVERLKVIMTLVATPEGRRTRDFDIGLVQLLNNKLDPAAELERAEALSKLDKTRWEAPALAAEMNAALDRYAESAKSLATAAGLAPADKKAKLNSAVEIASSQAKYQDLVNDGQKLSEDKKYEEAAKRYQEAWRVDQSHSETGMDAAVAYLMADQIKESVAVLTLLRQNDTNGSAQKTKAMLKQLAPVSEEAKEALNSADGGGGGTSLTGSAAERITKVIGELASADVRMIARPAPAFVEEQSAFPSLPDPELVSSDLAKLSPESVFDQYQHGIPVLPQGSSPGGVPGLTPPPETPGKDSPGPSNGLKAEPITSSPAPNHPVLSLPKFRPTPPPKEPDKPNPPE